MAHSCRSRGSPLAKDKREVPMARLIWIHLASKNSPVCVSTRPTNCSRKSRRAELEAELEKLTQYGKPPAKKAESAPAPKVKKTEKEPKESVAEAA